MLRNHAGACRNHRAHSQPLTLICRALQCNRSLRQALHRQLHRRHDPAGQAGQRPPLEVLLSRRDLPPFHAPRPAAHSACRLESTPQGRGRQRGRQSKTDGPGNGHRRRMGDAEVPCPGPAGAWRLERPERTHIRNAAPAPSRGTAAGSRWPRRQRSQPAARQSCTGSGKPSEVVEQHCSTRCCMHSARGALANSCAERACSDDTGCTAPAPRPVVRPRPKAGGQHAPKLGVPRATKAPPGPDGVSACYRAPTRHLPIPDSHYHCA